MDPQLEFFLKQIPKQGSGPADSSAASTPNNEPDAVILTQTAPKLQQPPSNAATFKPGLWNEIQLKTFGIFLKKDNNAILYFEWKANKLKYFMYGSWSEI